MKLGFLGFSKDSGPPIGGGAKNPKVDTSIRLQLNGRIAYAIAGDAIAIASKPGDIALLGKEPIADIGFCLEIENIGSSEATVCEIGLAGWFESPRIAVHEPIFHDAGGWPRTLAPGQSVVAHFSSGLTTHSVLKSLKRVYIRTVNDEVHYGPGGQALRHFIKQAKSQA